MHPPLTLDRFLTRFLLQPPAAVEPQPARRQAAVLVPVVARREQPGLLLTRRSPWLRKQADLFMRLASHHRPARGA